MKPLHHLVTWPLTLHLVARVQKAGILDFEASEEIEKAYLYKSIIKDTLTTQKIKKDKRLSWKDLYSL